MTEPNFPVLGQALSIELANTRFVRGGVVVEGLASVADARDWVRVNRELLDVAPSQIDESCRQTLLELRDDVRELLAAVVDGRPPAAAVVGELNRATANYPAHIELHWTRRGPRVERRRIATAGAADQLRAEIAEATALFVGGDDASWLRACPAPGCIGFFVKDHPRREWCSVACGNRARNARFHQRRQAASGTRG